MVEDYDPSITEDLILEMATAACLLKASEWWQLVKRLNQIWGVKLEW